MAIHRAGKEAEEGAKGRDTERGRELRQRNARHAGYRQRAKKRERQKARHTDP